LLCDLIFYVKTQLKLKKIKKDTDKKLYGHIS